MNPHFARIATNLAFYIRGAIRSYEGTLTLAILATVYPLNIHPSIVFIVGWDSFDYD
jgi:hypothetical protein